MSLDWCAEEVWKRCQKTQGGPHWQDAWPLTGTRLRRSYMSFVYLCVTRGSGFVSSWSGNCWERLGTAAMLPTTQPTSPTPLSCGLSIARVEEYGRMPRIHWCFLVNFERMWMHTKCPKCLHMPTCIYMHMWEFPKKVLGRLYLTARSIDLTARTAQNGEKSQRETMGNQFIICMRYAFVIFTKAARLKGN